MSKAILGFMVLVLAGSLAAAKERGLPPAEERVLAQFTKAALDAEKAYRETVLGILRVLGSRLVDHERAVVRKGEIKEGNRIRACRERIARLADEISRHDFLGGLAPEIDEDLVPPSAKETTQRYSGEISEAGGVYAAALRAARSDIGELLASAYRFAFDSADLDAANRVQEVEDAIDGEIAVRIEPLEYREVRFSSIRHAEEEFLLKTPEAWRVQDGELIGTAREGESLEATLARSYKRISAVTIRGRILPPSAHNLRLTVGPVNAIFNWELAAECHFRYHEERTEVRGNLLVPGREHEITVRQLTKRSIEVCVDGRRVWITHGTLFGTITAYPSVSTIGIREIRVLGVPDDSDVVLGPSHRRW